MERWAKLKTIRPGGEVKKVANVRAIPENNAEFIQLLSIAKTAEDFAALNTIFNLAIDPPSSLKLQSDSMGGMSMAAVLTQIACRDEKFFLIKHKISNKFGRLEIIKKQDRYVSIVNFKLIAHLIGNITLKLPRGSKIAKMFTPDITFNIQARPHTVVLHDKYEYHLFYDSSWLFIANNIYEGEDLQIEVEIDLNTRLLDIDIELSYYAIEPHDSQAYSAFMSLRERIKMDRVPVDNFTNLRVSVKSGQSAYFVHTYHLPFDDKPLYIDLNEQTRESSPRQTENKNEYVSREAKHNALKNKIEELNGKMAIADNHPFLTEIRENQSTERKSNRSPIDDPLNNLPELIRIAGNNMNRVVHRNFDDGYRVDRISYISDEELNAIPEITPNESASRQGSNSMQPGIRQINVEADQIRRELGMQTQESDAEVGLEMIMHPEIENNAVLRVDGQYLLRVTNASNETIQYVDVKTGKAVATVLPNEVVAAIGNIYE